MNCLHRNILKSLLVSILLLPGINGCKDDYTSIIPYVYINFSINPTNFIEFNIPGGSYYFPTQGFGGILIYRDMVDSSNPFLTFDTACTYEVTSSVRVTTDGSGIATCPKCGSQFILIGGSGSAIKGPAAQPLRQYKTYYSGSRIVVRN